MEHGEGSARSVCRPLRLFRELHSYCTLDTFCALAGIGGWNRTVSFSREEIEVGARDREFGICEF